MEQGNNPKIRKLVQESLAKAIRTESFQLKHFNKFGYEALLEACRKFGAKILIPKPQNGKVD